VRSSQLDPWIRLVGSSAPDTRLSCVLSASNMDIAIEIEPCVRSEK